MEIQVREVKEKLQSYDYKSYVIVVGPTFAFVRDPKLDKPVGPIQASLDAAMRWVDRIMPTVASLSANNKLVLDVLAAGV